ncbi:MAG: hypothetical protein KUG81_03370 [Gammaproteobacteria bacterium]|nr:hypothetical protein [Gammaproteobacteria bacterium]
MPNKLLKLVPAQKTASTGRAKAARRLARRYMPMKLKFIYIILALVLPSFTYGCAVPNIIEDGSVTITPDKDSSSGMYHVRVPGIYKGAQIEFLVLSVSNGSNEISLPLSIKSKGDVTGSHFYMSSQWVNIRISASYKDMQCTELVAKLSM